MAIEDLNNNPIINSLRTGTENDSYYPYENIPDKVVGNKVQLNEIPDPVQKVRVVDPSSPSTVYFETKSTPSTPTQYMVDYRLGAVYFSSAAEGKSLQFSYFGRGAVLTPASRIYTQLDNGNVTETLGDIISAGRDGIENINTLNTLVENTNTATADVLNAKEQIVADGTQAITQLIGHRDSFVYIPTDYSVTQQYKVNNQVTYNNYTYICIQDTIGHDPTNTSYWRIYAAGKDSLIKAKSPMIATEGQTDFSIADLGSVAIGSNKIIGAIVGGVPQPPTAYTQISPTLIRFPVGLSAGTTVALQWIDGNIGTAAGHNAQHRAGGGDELNIKELAGYQTEVKDKLDTTTAQLADTTNQTEAINTNLSLKANQTDLNAVASNLQVLNDVAPNLISGAWQSASSSNATVVVDASNNVVITKVTGVNVHVFAPLSQNVLLNKKYRMTITAKTTDATISKNFFLRDAVLLSGVGMHQQYFMTTGYTTCSFDFVATSTTSAQLAINTSRMNTSEVITIAAISLKELVLEPTTLDASNLIQNGYNVNNTVWTSPNTSVITATLKDNNALLTKLLATSGIHVTVPLTTAIVMNKRYRLTITAKTSDASLTKSFFLKNPSNGANLGATSAISITTSYATYTLDITATDSATCVLAISSSALNTSETVSISSISLKEVVEVVAIPPITITQTARPVLWGTDWWTDVDDVAAARILCWAERMGMVDIVALGISACMTNSVVSLDAYFDFEGRPGLTIGIDKAATDYGGTPPYQNNMITSRHSYNDNNGAEDAVTMYRRALVNAKQKVDIIEVGYPQVLANLLKSPSDSISNLTGLDLVTQKVNKLWMMAGTYPSGSENNFTRNTRSRTAGNYLCANWPTPITFLGYEVGSTVFSGGTLATVSPVADDLLTQALADYGSPGGRASWDPMLTLLACYGNADQSGYSTIKGSNFVDPTTGANTFTPNVNGKHEYVVKIRTDNWYKNQLNAILERKAWPTRPLGAAQLPKV